MDADMMEEAMDYNERQGRPAAAEVVGVLGGGRCALPDFLFRRESRCRPIAGGVRWFL